MSLLFLCAETDGQSANTNSTLTASVGGHKIYINKNKCPTELYERNDFQPNILILNNPKVLHVTSLK